MKQFLSILLAAVLLLSATAALADGVTIAVPNDATNYGRALILLADAGLLTLDEYESTPTTEDIVETLMMNLIYQGAFATMPPLLQMEKMPLQVIRPLCLLEEKDLRRYAELREYPRQTKLCPFEKASSRAEVKDLLAALERLNPNVRDSMWGAMENVKTDYLPKRINN